MAAPDRPWPQVPCACKHQERVGNGKGIIWGPAKNKHGQLKRSTTPPSLPRPPTLSPNHPCPSQSVRVPAPDRQIHLLFPASPLDRADQQFVLLLAFYSPSSSSPSPTLSPSTPDTRRSCPDDRDSLVPRSTLETRQRLHSTVVQRLDQRQEQRSRGNATDRARPIERIERTNIFRPSTFPVSLRRPADRSPFQTKFDWRAFAIADLAGATTSQCMASRAQADPPTRQAVDIIPDPSLSPSKGPPPFFFSHDGVLQNTHQNITPRPLLSTTRQSRQARPPRSHHRDPPHPPRLPPTTPTAVLATRPNIQLPPSVSSRATMAAQ